MDEWPIESDVEYFQRRLFAALQIPRKYLEEAQPSNSFCWIWTSSGLPDKERTMGDYLYVPYGQQLRCRVRGQEGGGWKGDSGWIGTIRFIEGFAGGPLGLSVQIPKLGFTEEVIESIDYPTLDQVPDNVEFSIQTRSHGFLTFVIHRDDANKLGRIARYLEDASSGPRTVAATAAYAEGLKIEEYAPSPEDQVLITLWDTLFGLTNDDGQVGRTLAVALVRRAVYRPGQPVLLKPFRSCNFGAPEIVASILQCTGLWRFAEISHDKLVIKKPGPGADMYDWSRLSEQFHAPLEELKLDMHASPDVAIPICADPSHAEGLREALQLIRRMGNHPEYYPQNEDRGY